MYSEPADYYVCLEDGGTTLNGRWVGAGWCTADQDALNRAAVSGFIIPYVESHRQTRANPAAVFRIEDWIYLKAANKELMQMCVDPESKPLWMSECAMSSLLSSDYPPYAPSIGTVTGWSRSSPGSAPSNPLNGSGPTDIAQTLLEEAYGGLGTANYYNLNSHNRPMYVNQVANLGRLTPHMPAGTQHSDAMFDFSNDKYIFTDNMRMYNEVYFNHTYNVAQMLSALNGEYGRRGLSTELDVARYTHLSDFIRLPATDLREFTTSSSYDFKNGCFSKYADVVRDIYWDLSCCKWMGAPISAEQYVEMEYNRLDALESIDAGTFIYDTKTITYDTQIMPFALEGQEDDQLVMDFYYTLMPDPSDPDQYIETCCPNWYSVYKKWDIYLPACVTEAYRFMVFQLRAGNAIYQNDDYTRTDFYPMVRFQLVRDPYITVGKGYRWSFAEGDLDKLFGVDGNTGIPNFIDNFCGETEIMQVIKQGAHKYVKGYHPTYQEREKYIRYFLYLRRFGVICKNEFNFSWSWPDAAWQYTPKVYPPRLMGGEFPGEN